MVNAPVLIVRLTKPISMASHTFAPSSQIAIGKSCFGKQVEKNLFLYEFY